jgi:hypothetical protein
MRRAVRAQHLTAQRLTAEHLTAQQLIARQLTGSRYECEAAGPALGSSKASPSG